MMEKIPNNILENKINKYSKRRIQNINQRLLVIKNSIYKKEEQKKRLAKTAKKQYRGIDKTMHYYEKNNTKQGVEFLKYKSLEYKPFVEKYTTI